MYLAELTDLNRALDQWERSDAPASRQAAGVALAHAAYLLLQPYREADKLRAAFNRGTPADRFRLIFGRNPLPDEADRILENGLLGQPEPTDEPVVIPDSAYAEARQDR